MSAAKVIVEILKAIPAVVRAFRRPAPIPQRVDVEPIKPPTRYPSAMVDDGDGKPRVF